MSYAELAAMKAHVESMMAEKQLAEKAELKQKLADMAKKGGFSLDELMGKARKTSGKGRYQVSRSQECVPIPGRAGGRMPRWMTAATKGGKAKKRISSFPSALLARCLLNIYSRHAPGHCRGRIHSAWRPPVFVIRTRVHEGWLAQTAS